MYDHKRCIYTVLADPVHDVHTHNMIFALRAAAFPINLLLTLPCDTCTHTCTHMLTDTSIQLCRHTLTCPVTRAHTHTHTHMHRKTCTFTHTQGIRTQSTSLYLLTCATAMKDARSALQQGQGFAICRTRRLRAEVVGCTSLMPASLVSKQPLQKLWPVFV